MLANAFVTDTLRAQGTVQSINTTRGDVVQLTSGYRASRVIGSTVYNERTDTIGTIDDLVASPKDRVTYAILSVGGFPGPGTHQVAVPFDRLHVVDKQMRLPGATRDSLKALPEFRYASPGPPGPTVSDPEPRDLGAFQRHAGHQARIGQHEGLYRVSRG
ncbi:PRC-barrel domain containing protein [Paraburkholderia sp. RL16-012-BIC-B]|uniref:PRC-barrel domain-containing protein n=1 Tax=Paraburkholderia madseniana TaxID=2599607 RepID=UPI0015591F2F|nr:PRC-barrel domain-containing protein [Paraburkholderia madseniana]NPT67114.1 PRC-barrel domain containing protein [Paraburkholderia madseniana]